MFSQLGLIVILAGVYAQDLVRISNCEENDGMQVIPSEIIEIVPEWESDEKHLVNNYEWKYEITYRDDSQNLVTFEPVQWLQQTANGTQKLFIPRYSLIPKRYNVTVSSKRKPSVQSGPDTALEKGFKICKIAMRSYKPVAVISGGYERTVPPNTPIFVHGYDSYDLNLDNSSNNLIYRWSCNQTREPPTFCNKDPISTDMEFTIPPEAVTDGDVFKISLKVSLEYFPNPNNTRTKFQTIVVKSNVPSLNITCRKNCRSFTSHANYEMVTVVTVSCISNCQGIQDDDYMWSVSVRGDSSYSFDYSKSRYGERGTKFVVEKNTFSGNKSYIVEARVNTTDGVGYASLRFSYFLPPKVSDCRLNPSDGKSMETYFQFSCTQDPPRLEYFYEFIARDSTDIFGEELIISGVYPDVFRRKFKLPPSEGKTFIAKATRISWDSYPSIEVEVEGRVESALATKSSDEFVKILDDIYNGNGTNQSILSLVGSGSSEDRSKAIDVFQTIVDELVVRKIEDEATKDFLDTLKYTASEDMLKAPLESIEEVVKLSHSLTELQHKNIPAEADPLLTKYTTTLCKKMADKSLQMLQHDEFLLHKGDRMQKFSGTMAKCFETTMNPNYGIMVPIELNVTTQEPMPNEPLITENYANYVDHDDSYYQNLDYLKESSYNIISGSAASAKVVAMTTATGEGLIRTFGNKTETIVFKDTGSDLIRKPIRSKGVTLNCSKDFENDDHSYDLLMTSWERDIMWWNPAFVKVHTNVINLEFWHSTCKEKISSFTHPMDIYFTWNVDMQFVPTSKNYSFSVPKGYNAMYDEELNYQIKVHRIVLPKRLVLHVSVASNDVFDVVLLENKFPTVDDFADDEIVKTGTNHSLQLVNDYDYNVFAYIGILIAKDTAVENTSLMYEISAIVTCCIEFIELESKWQPTCKPGSTDNLTILYCKCNHFSVLAGYRQDVATVLQDVLHPDLNLIICSSSVIFSTVALVLVIFFLLLVFSLFQRKEEYYFLGDNAANCRFAYLVMVKTGDGYSSGTSSNVVLRLNGDRDSSQPHVLNYPDPELRLLQQFNRDLFVLATESYLGNLQSLEIWIDSIGQNPGWYCKNITVYDLQGHTEWYFDIEKRISVTGGTTYLVSGETRHETPVEDKATTKKFPFVIAKKLPFATTKKFPFVTIKKISFAKIRSGLDLLRRYHIWYLWQKEESFSYIKKITVILSTVLTTFSLALILLGQPKLRLNDGFDQHEFYTLSPYSIFVAFGCSFPTFLIHSAIAWCFRFSEIQYSRYEQDSKLSLRYTVACWCILLVLIVACTSHLVILGFWVPYYTSLIWLTTTVIGIITGILIYETIFFFVVHSFHKSIMVYDVKKKFRDIWVSIEIQRRYLFATFGKVLLRPYFQHLYQPLEKKQIKGKSLVINHRLFVISELQDLIMFAVYVVTLYMVILANKDSSVVFGKMEMEELMDGRHTNSFSFRDIDTANDIYVYINETLIPSIQPLKWYKKYVVSEPGLMADVNNKYIGVARLRQHRMKSNVCKVPKPMEFLNMTCWPEFAQTAIETGTFGYKWGNFTPYVDLDRLKMIWQYATEKKTETLLAFGEISSYSGGGYVAYLGRTLYNSYLNFRKILTKLWIDQATRVIFIEFLTYNANCNIFSSVRLIFEQSATGFINKDVTVYTVRMLFVKNEVAYISTVVFTLFTVWVVLLLFKQSLGIIKHLHTFYKDLWLMIDFIILLLSISCIVLFTLRISFVGSYLKTMETSRNNEFLSYFYLFYIEDYLSFAAAFLVCIATIRLWKFLRFAQMFRIMERTLALAALSLVCFAIVFGIILVAVGMVVTMLAGNEFRRIRWFGVTIRSLLTMALRASEVQASDFLSHRLVITYLVVYILTLIVSMYIFIMIIVLAYARAQLEFSSEIEIYSIKSYVLERSAYLRSFFKYKSKRLRAGLTEVVQNKVVPKSDKFLYLNSYSIAVPKMRFMKYVMQGFIRKHTRKTSTLSSYDVRLMEMICRQIFTKRQEDEVDVFYKGRVGGQRVRLVDEKHIEKIANVTNLLLQEERLETFMQEEKNPLFERCVKAIRRQNSVLRHCSLNLNEILHRVAAAESHVPRH